MKQQLFLTPLSVSSVVGDGKRALSPIGVALSSLCDNGGSEEGTGRGLIWIARVLGLGWAPFGLILGRLGRCFVHLGKG